MMFIKLPKLPRLATVLIVAIAFAPTRAHAAPGDCFFNSLDMGGLGSMASGIADLRNTIQVAGTSSGGGGGGGGIVCKRTSTDADESLLHPTLNDVLWRTDVWHHGGIGMTIGGGKAVVSTNGHFRRKDNLVDNKALLTIQTADIWAYENLHFIEPASDENVLTYLKRVLQTNLASVSPQLYEQLMRAFDRIHFTPIKAPVTPIDDMGLLSLPESCYYTQLAFRHNPSQGATGPVDIDVNMGLFNRLGFRDGRIDLQARTLQQAGLLLHEALYLLGFVGQDQNTSEATRNLTALLLSQDFRPLLDLVPSLNRPRNGPSQEAQFALFLATRGFTPELFAEKKSALTQKQQDFRQSLLILGSKYENILYDYNQSGWLSAARTNRNDFISNLLKDVSGSAEPNSAFAYCAIMAAGSGKSVNVAQLLSAGPEQDKNLAKVCRYIQDDLDGYDAGDDDGIVGRTMTYTAEIAMRQIRSRALQYCQSKYSGDY
jgi:hypothetical protein